MAKLVQIKAATWKKPPQNEKRPAPSRAVQQSFSDQEDLEAPHREKGNRCIFPIVIHSDVEVQGVHIELQVIDLRVPI